MHSPCFRLYILLFHGLSEYSILIGCKCNRSQLSLLRSALCTMMRQTTGTVADGEFIGMEMPILDGAERKYNNEVLRNFR